MSLTRLSSFSLTMASVCTSSSSEEPPWRSSPSTIRFFGMKPGRPSSVAWETKFGITSSSPTRQTPKIRTDLHRGVRIVGLPLEEALQPGADVVAQPAEPIPPAAAVPPARATRLSLVAGLPITSVMVARDTRTCTLGAISTITVWSPASTLVTLPRMPPPVTTWSPRFRFSTMSRCCFTFCCCGRIIRK